jgi:hypothetical protein
VACKSASSGSSVPTGTVPVMTTTFPAPAPVRTPPTVAPAPSGCAVERRAVGTAARDLAEGLTGIAFDAPCCPARQKAILEFSAGVLRLVQGIATRTGEVALHRACRAVDHAMPVFAGDVSAGAPGLAGAWIAVAELFPVTGAPSDHTAEELLACERRFRSTAVRASFGVPWFADACSPRERLLLARNAPRRLRLSLRLTEDRWLDLRDAVRGSGS